MILINLLPHREAARKRRRDMFNVSLGVSAVLGGIISGTLSLAYQGAVEAQQETNAYLQSEIKVLETQIKDIAGLEGEIAALRARQQAVEDLQSDRNLPVHLLMDAVNQLPDGVFINKLQQEGLVVTLTGVAQSNERISELLRNLTNNTPWLAKPELVEIIVGTVGNTAKEQKRIYNFKLRVRILRASDVDKTTTKPGSTPNNSSS